MRRLVVWGLVVLAAGCARSAGGPPAGAPSAEGAVRAFLFAARANDFRGVAAVWGNAESPVRDRAKPDEVERRVMIIACHLRHESATLGAPQPGPGGRVVIPVELTQGEVKATTTFTAVQHGKSGRWFVEDLGLASVAILCK